MTTLKAAASSAFGSVSPAIAGAISLAALFGLWSPDEVAWRIAGRAIELFLTAYDGAARIRPVNLSQRCATRPVVKS